MASRDERAKRLRVIVDAEELELHTYVKCRNAKLFPKKDRGPSGLPARMVDAASGAVDDIAEANDRDLRDSCERDERLSLQCSALRRLRRLNRYIKMAYDLKCISEEEFAYWSKLAVNVRNQCAAWHKSDKRRKADITERR